MIFDTTEALAVHERLMSQLPVRTVGDPATVHFKQGGRKPAKDAEQVRLACLALKGSGMTQEQMAEKVGCTRQTVRRHLGTMRKEVTPAMIARMHEIRETLFYHEIARECGVSTSTVKKYLRPDA
jgi:predicted transcriptional regulator